MFPWTIDVKCVRRVGSPPRGRYGLPRARLSCVLLGERLGRPETSSEELFRDPLFLRGRPLRVGDGVVAGVGVVVVGGVAVCCCLLLLLALLLVLVMCVAVVVGM